MKIVLTKTLYIHPNITPVLGLGYLSSWLKKHDFDTSIIDGNLLNLNNQKLLQKILAEKPDVVGITCLSGSYHEVVELSQMLKKENIPCVIGGVHPTFLPYQTLVDSKADFVICGEGEIAFLKLLQNNLVNNNIPGVYSLDNLKSNDDPISRGEIIENLDDLPFPDWQQMEPKSYPIAPQTPLVKSWPIATVMSSRGCPYDCSFCASAQFYNRRIRFRSPENVVSEIEYLVNNHGVKEIHFVDDSLTQKREHVEKICNLIIEKNIKVSWATPNGIRADRVDKELLLLMKKSGCYLVYFGVESANPKILKQMKKSETIDDIKKAITLANEIGLITDAYFIFGLPGETKETIEETIQFAINSDLTRAHFFALDVLPGCRIWNEIKNNYNPKYNKKSYAESEWAPEGLTPDDLSKAFRDAHRRFYFHKPHRIFHVITSIKPSQFKIILRKFKTAGVLKSFFECFTKSKHHDA
jgi:radical SAM superfamily enzyme YgiQ (UPF0313 family)